MGCLCIFVDDVLPVHPIILSLPLIESLERYLSAKLFRDPMHIVQTLTRTKIGIVPKYSRK